jgi:hypothetical protein
MPRDRLGMRRFVEARVGEADREGANRAIRDLRHRRDHRRRVDAARQERADIDVGNHLLADRVEPLVAELLDPLRFGPRLGGMIGGHPIGAQRRHAARLNGHHMARRQRADLRVDRARRADMPEAEIIVERAGVDVERHPRQQRQRLEFGTEREPGGLVGIIERLDPDGIARQRQPTRVHIPHRDREHAVELRPDVVAPAFVAGKDDLGIARALEHTAERLQLAPQVTEIVDLAVEDQRVAAVGRVEGLMPAFDVDDAQPAHPEAEVAIGHHALVVGAAVQDRVALRGDQGCGDEAGRNGTATPRVKAGNSADDERSLA